MSSTQRNLSADAEWYVREIIQSRVKMEWMLAQGADIEHHPILSPEARSRMMSELRRDINEYKFKQYNEVGELKKEVARRVVPLLEQMLAALENAPENIVFEPETPIRPRKKPQAPVLRKDMTPGQFGEYVEKVFQARQPVWSAIGKKYDAQRRFSNEEIRKDATLLLTDMKQGQLLGRDTPEANRAFWKVVEVCGKQTTQDLSRLARRLDRRPGSVTDREIRTAVIHGLEVEKFNQLFGISDEIYDLLLTIEKSAKRREKR
jgi:hypothetical protein